MGEFFPDYNMLVILQVFYLFSTNNLAREETSIASIFFLKFGSGSGRTTTGTNSVFALTLACFSVTFLYFFISG